MVTWKNSLHNKKLDFNLRVKKSPIKKFFQQFNELTSLLFFIWRQILTAYVSATSGAMAVALGLNTFVKVSFYLWFSKRYIVWWEHEILPERFLLTTIVIQST